VPRIPTFEPPPLAEDPPRELAPSRARPSIPASGKNLYAPGQVEPDVDLELGADPSQRRKRQSLAGAPSAASAQIIRPTAKPMRRSVPWFLIFLVALAIGGGVAYKRGLLDALIERLRPAPKEEPVDVPKAIEPPPPPPP
jgi:hypothetical protein